MRESMHVTVVGKCQLDQLVGEVWLNSSVRVVVALGGGEGGRTYTVMPPRCSWETSAEIGFCVDGIADVEILLNFCAVC